jgi:hypothetical protein
MRANARLGLELRRKFGRGGLSTQEAGEHSGVARAASIASGRKIPIETIRRMRGFFARHKRDREAAGWGSRTNPSAGWIAHLLWGGTAAERWANRILREYDGE